ncbi:extracellular solute-binding protein [Paenibacillus urinalis]|uniref:Extracellular solute-binding protein n=1 Tax=Paenibacillus urinalis TaxID=521520 RepID=A0AAX3MWU7_9BACL|nr:MULTISPECIES: extracellular solute-binding protein [Paenibacillus]WDH82086.1 extracellular solute-binding protein [Paenibacillus urinalis]WDH98141.1 extracellular solute-binding protein [Paenibacillus urinalis]WDI01824.1 extracellular solute-binding protein [Paenibacillus urinalis]GAK42645.1 sugar ABC transporter sugar-binding protein [Paenibacillus sp. TCA20]
MNRKKGLLTIVSMLLMVIVLAGCSSDDKNTITFWTPLTGEDGAYMDQLVKEYNATEPEMKVKHVITSDMYTKLSTVINSGKGIPDLAIIHADRVPGYVKQNVLEPMTGILSAQPEINENNYLPQAWSTGTIDGTQYTVPLDIHANVMYYNKDLLAKYGAESFLDDNNVTVEEILSLQGKMEEGDYVVNDALLGWAMLGQLQNLGGDVQQDGQPAVNTPEMKQAYESVKQIADAGLMTPFGEDGYLMFQSGNVLFSTDGTWSSTAHAGVEGLNFGVTNVYSASPDKFTNRSSSHLFAMLTNEARTDEKEAGIGSFLEFIRQNSIEWAKAGQIVASKQVFESPEYQDYMQSFFTTDEKQIESLYIYTYEYYPYVAEVVDKYSNDIIRGNVDMDETLQTMQKEVEDKIAQGSTGAQ